jgi:GR25 family glycosyltransferase involved in LPS biosynthesis
LLKDPKYQVYLVLEDDVKLSPHTIKILNAIPDKMNELFSDWDILFLGNHAKHQREVEKNRLLIEKYDEEKFMQMSYGGTFCYLINQRGAQKLLQNLLANGMNYAIDWDMSRMPGLNNYYIHPMVGTSEMANNKEKVDSDIQKMSFHFQSDVNEWILKDIQTMQNVLKQDGILYFEKDSFNQFIYDTFKFSPTSNIIVSRNIVHKNLMFSHVCFTQISYDNCVAVQQLLQSIIEQKLPILFYLMYEMYVVTVPETFYTRHETMKHHFSFNNKMDIDYIL